MQLEIKFKSIAVRWFFNMFLIVVLIVCAVVIGFIAVVNSLYTEKMAMYAADITYEFNSLSETTPATFRDTAIDMAENFGFKDKLEVQVIDRDDNVVVTTTGFQPSDGKMEDYEEAKLTGSAVADSKTSGGEHVLAGTTALYDSSGKYLGAYRWITTLENADRRISGLIITLVVTGLLVLAFCAFSGLFFIKSIVTPIRDVSNIARKIAMGDFGSRIEITKNDEIGELCDTINYMASELSQAENMKNDFISSVSHELRTPLTAIKGWGETVKMSIGTDEALVKRGIDVVLSEADRLSGLVEELPRHIGVALVDRMQPRIAKFRRPMVVKAMVDFRFHAGDLRFAYITEAVNHIRRRNPFSLRVFGMKIHQIPRKISRQIIVNLVVKRV